MRPCNQSKRSTFSGYVSCQDVHKQLNTIKDYFFMTHALRRLIKSNKDIVNDYRAILDR